MGGRGRPRACNYRSGPRTYQTFEIANACIDGVDALTSLHLGCVNFRGRPATAYRSYAAFAPYFKDLDYEMARRTPTNDYSHRPFLVGGYPDYTQAPQGK